MLPSGGSSEQLVTGHVRALPLEGEIEATGGASCLEGLAQHLGGLQIKHLHNQLGTAVLHTTTHDYFMQTTLK